ncbi:hypothetical protein [Chitinophaga arvensicola]|uniref:Uncharacterized protein n=1 Tax=Chitinophaga arvensicola TaxID=29529 RepID=A0A1I0S783_9BACT|nr:hypothetical protein [Chitinophaga arvensicola]SEW51575.1 hypothetical protein SAMN04488122_4331 [Chitinophaga arvensicola]
MFKMRLLKLFCTILCLISCSERQSRKEGSNNLIYKTCSLLIECPNNTSYYSISFNYQGEGIVGFCFEKRDTINYSIQKNDSLIKLIAFHLTSDDKRHVDSLLINIPLLKNDNKKLSHDSFKYTLKLDNLVKSENVSDTNLYGILKIIKNNFPKEAKHYDFCGFFEAFSYTKISSEK